MNMKILFISDIHGIKTNLTYIDKKYHDWQCDKLVVLGDLYTGSLHSLDYDIKYVQLFLSKHKDHLVCIRGNCDSEADIEVADYPIMPNCLMKVDGLSLYLTHGHIFNIDNKPKTNNWDILIYGHKHVPFIKNSENKYFLNPGSISLPRDQFGPTYMLYSDRVFTIYDLNDNKIDTLNLQ